MFGLLLLIGGLIAGLLAGLLGIGGGSVLVPILLALGAEPVQAIATSSLAIIITSVSGSLQNWRMGQLQWQQVLPIGLPAVVLAQLGVRLANVAADQVLLIAFGLLMLLNLYLLTLRQRLAASQKVEQKAEQQKTSVAQRSLKAQVATGSLAGAIAGLLGVGGGAIMVPLQMLLLQESIKRAIQTSLGVVVLTAIASTAGHALNGNVLWWPGLILGFGGLLTAQFSTRLLPKLPEQVVSRLFRSFLVITALYSFWKAWSA